MKNSIKEIKNELENEADQIEERISDSEDKSRNDAEGGRATQA